MMLSSSRRKSGFSLNSGASGPDRMGIGSGLGFHTVAEEGSMALAPGVTLSAVGATAALERLEAALALLGRSVDAGGGKVEDDADPAAVAMAPAELREMLSSAAVTLRQSLRRQRDNEDGSRAGYGSTGGGAGGSGTSGGEELFALTEAMEVDATNQKWLMDSYGGGTRSGSPVAGGLELARMTSTRSETGVLAIRGGPPPVSNGRRGTGGTGGARRHSALPGAANFQRLALRKRTASQGRPNGGFTPPAKHSKGLRSAPESTAEDSLSI